MAILKTTIFYLSISIIMKSSISQGDHVFEHFRPDIQKEHYNKLKIWHRYTMFFLQKNLQYKMPNMVNPQPIFCHLFYLSKKFRKALKLINWEDRIWTKMIYKNDPHLRFYNESRLKITLPAGYINIGSEFKRGSVTYFIFKLDRLTRLNLTLFTIYFSIKLKVCHRHHLFISSEITNLNRRKKYDLKDFINNKITVSTDLENFQNVYVLQDYRMFCGHYPTFSYYPDYDQVILGILWKTNDETFRIQNSFTVIDKHIISNINAYNITWKDITLGSNNGFDSRLIFLMQFPFKAILKVFFLKIMTTHKLVIHFHIFKPDRYVVFNGPGFSSEILKDKNNVVTTSSFQCIVQILSKGQQKGQSNVIFTYFPTKVEHVTILKLDYLDTIKYCLPYREYNDLHVIHLHTKVGYQVNVTILNYTSTMDLYPHCSFGGLHFSEKLSERYEDGRVVCSSYDIGRSYYSHNATLTFVYYQYKMYDFVQVTLQITQTQCKHVEINICYFYNHCFYALSTCISHIFSNNKRKCNSYLNNVTTHINASLLIREKGLALISNKEECILLEFVCIFENLPVNNYGNLKAPIKLLLKITLL